MAWPVNSCTGEELEAFMARNGGWDSFDKVVYIGDGANDLCPILHLRPCVSVLTPSWRNVR